MNATTDAIESLYERYVTDEFFRLPIDQLPMHDSHPLEDILRTAEWAIQDYLEASPEIEIEDALWQLFGVLGSLTTALSARAAARGKAVAK